MNDMYPPSLPDPTSDSFNMRTARHVLDSFVANENAESDYGLTSSDGTLYLRARYGVEPTIAWWAEGAIYCNVGGHAFWKNQVSTTLGHPKRIAGCDLREGLETNWTFDGHPRGPDEVVNLSEAPA